jgi:ABC-type lipoprotein release transport system permease subunit
MGLLMGSILLLMGGIGILNLMLMAVFERTREMGVLAAMGLKGRQIMGLFVMEGSFIGLVGAVIGCFLSWLLIAWVGRTGLDFSSMVADLEDAGEIYAMMGTVLYPAMSAATIMIYGFAAIVVAALAALIPAWQAAHKEPAESLHFV